MCSPSKYDIWDIDLKLNAETIADIGSDRCTLDVLDLITYVSHTNSNFILDMEKNDCTFIELFLRNIACFHINRLNTENSIQKKYYPVFWCKSTSYAKARIHTHTDHCDYEKTIFNTANNFPALTTITYLSENNNIPTLLTDVNKYMCNTAKFNHILNEKLVLVLPRMLRHFSFTGGVNIHGEGYLDENTNRIDRKTLVLTLWETPPLMTPKFSSDIFHAHSFNTQKISIDRNFLPIPLNEIKTFNNDINVIEIKNINSQITRIVMKNNDIINDEFFNSLIIKKDRNVLFKLKSHVVNNITNNGVFEFDIKQCNKWKPKSNISQLMCHGLSNWQLNIDTTNYDKHANKFFNDCKAELHKKLIMHYTFDRELLFNMHSEYYNQVEQYIYYIAKFHITRVMNEITETGRELKEIYVSFYINGICNNQLNISNDDSIQTIITSLDNNNDYSIITDINYDMYKYKQLEGSNIGLIYNNNSHVSFSGNYYTKYGKNTLIIRLWQLPPKNMSTYQNDNINNVNTSYSKLNTKILNLAFKTECKNTGITSIILDPDTYKRQLMPQILYTNIINIDHNIIPVHDSTSNICIISPTNLNIINTSQNIQSINIGTINTIQPKLKSIVFLPPK